MLTLPLQLNQTVPKLHLVIPPPLKVIKTVEALFCIVIAIFRLN